MSRVPSSLTLCAALALAMWVLPAHAARPADPPADPALVTDSGTLPELWSAMDAGAIADTSSWQELPPPGRTTGLYAVYDSLRDRMIVFGGLSADDVPAGDVWTWEPGARPSWRRLEPLGEAPPPRYGCSVAFDAVNNRLIVFGGQSKADWRTLLNDVWSLSLSDPAEWTRLAALGTPPSPRSGATAVIDGARDRLILFGGGNGFWPWDDHNDAWTLSLSGPMTWARLEATGDSLPAPRSGAAGAYDLRRDRLIVHGGRGNGESYADLWELSLRGTPTWRVLSPSGDAPGPFTYHRLLSDVPDDRLLIFDVRTTGFWALDLAEPPHWSRVVPAGSDQVGFAYAGASSVALDTRRQRALMYGDFVRSAPGVPYPTTWEMTRDLWAMPLSADPSWSLVEREERPEWRNGHVAVYDPRRDRILVHGGLPMMSGIISGGFSDTWAFDLRRGAGWSEIAAGGEALRAVGHCGAYDPFGDRLVVAGGSYYRLAGLLALSLTGTPTWSPLAPLGTAPPGGNSTVSLVCDPPRRRMLLMMWNASGPDIWAFPLGDAPAWTHLALRGTPPPSIALNTAIYDPRRDRVLVLGIGAGANPVGVWALSLGDSSTWRPLVAAGGPPRSVLGRTYGLVLDQSRDRLVLYTGRAGLASEPAAPSGIYAFSLGSVPSWSELRPVGAVPGARDGFAACLDPLRDRMVVVLGGYFVGPDWNMENHFNDEWALQFGTPVVDVSVDVKPGDDGDAFPTRSHGVTPVAILSRRGFDADSVLPGTVTLAGAPVDARGDGLASFERRDVNGDGLADLVVHVRTDEMALAPGDTLAILRGRCAAGSRILGFGHVRVVPAARAPRSGAETVADDALAPGLALAGGNPVRIAAGPFAVRYTLPTSEPARLELLDVQGRRLAARDLDAGAGRSGHAWLPLARARAGSICFVRVRQGAWSATRRIVVLP